MTRLWVPPSWESECCGDDITVGATVSWPLLPLAQWWDLTRLRLTLGEKMLQLNGIETHHASDEEGRRVVRGPVTSIVRVAATEVRSGQSWNIVPTSATFSARSMLDPLTGSTNHEDAMIELHALKRYGDSGVEAQHRFMGCVVTVQDGHVE
ncbi:hypothetical protein DVJ78_12830 [Humibacter sp. BT305]|nr:hypothetical protein DVJ78_12830 [Humibacter sp. BT305]